MHLHSLKPALRRFVLPLPQIAALAIWRAAGFFGDANAIAPLCDHDGNLNVGADAHPAFLEALEAAAPHVLSSRESPDFAPGLLTDGRFRSGPGGGYYPEEVGPFAVCGSFRLAQLRWDFCGLLTLARHGPFTRAIEMPRAPVLPIKIRALFGVRLGGAIGDVGQGEEREIPFDLVREHWGRFLPADIEIPLPYTSVEAEQARRKLAVELQQQRTLKAVR